MGTSTGYRDGGGGGRFGMRETKALLQDRIEELLAHLLPGGKREGRLYVVYNPVTNDGKRDPALKIAVRGEPGAWNDWRSGDKGDVIDLIAYVRGADRKDALAFGKDFLGISRMSDRDREAVRRKIRAEERIRHDADARRELWKRERAFEMFLKASPDLGGTPAEAYFAARGTPLLEIPNLSANSYRFMPALEWWKGATYHALPGGRREKISPGPRLPALVSAMRSPEGILTAVHCTFLRADGSGKAEVDPPKLMFGTVAGSVIRVADGPSGEAAESCAAPAPLVITEGNEDGWSAALALPEARVWAAGSVSAIANAPVWMDCVESVVVARQNDIGNIAATEAVERALDRLAEHGKPVAAMESHVGKDINDLIRGEG